MGERGKHFEGEIPGGGEVVTKPPSDGRRVALVIGNAAYQHTSVLKNPVNDARAMTKKLQNVDFEVISGLDLNYAEMAGLVRDFSRKARTASTSLLFYAGHGVQVEGRNYLVPIDATLEHESDVSAELMELQPLLNQISAVDRTSIILLDACRNNPLAKNLVRAMGMRSADVGSGLAATVRTSGSFIAFATAPDHIAYDGEDTHGYFTEELLSRIETPGLEVTDLMRQVRSSVRQRTENKERGAQIPWHQEALEGPFYFSPSNTATQNNAQAAPVMKTQPEPQQEANFAVNEEALFESTALQHWEAVKGEPTPEKLRAFLSEYGTSKMGNLAREALQGLANKAWRKVKKKDEAALKTFINDYPGTNEVAFATENLIKLELEKPTVSSSKDDNTVLWKLIVSGILIIVVIGGAIIYIYPTSKRFEPEMVRIPGGIFEMGCVSGNGCEDDEKPVRRVTIKPFEIGKYEITFDEWQACVDDGNCKPKKIERNIRKERHPIVFISWNEIKKNYLPWLNNKSGKNYRLPTEAEWEYAARGNSEAAYWWGDIASTKYANYHKLKKWKTSSPIGSFPQNPFGLYDMHGNVSEWTEDCLHKNYTLAPKDGSAWLDEFHGNCDIRIIRGGYWDNYATYIRSANRFWFDKNQRNEHIGFRLARTISP